LSSAATAIVFTTLLFGFVAVRVDRHQQNHQLLATVAGSSDNPRVGAFGRLEPTWIFYGGRPIDELTLDSPDSPRGARSPWKPKPRPLAAEYYGDGRDCFIFTTDRQWAELQKALPPQACVVAECSLFLRDDRLLLIGRKDVPVRSASRDSDSAK